MEQVEIRRAEKKDIPFLVHGNRAMAKETENKVLEESVLSRGVEAVFENEWRGFYCVAEENGRPIGQLMITFEWSDWRNGVFWWIQSVYVEVKYRRKGIYKRLYAFIFDQARKDPSVCGLRLYVDKNNRRAKKVYERCGMNEAHYAMFEMDFVLSVQPEISRRQP